MNRKALIYKCFLLYKRKRTKLTRRRGVCILIWGSNFSIENSRLFASSSSSDPLMQLIRENLVVTGSCSFTNSKERLLMDSCAVAFDRRINNAGTEMIY
jgi:hypothetical protein